MTKEQCVIPRCLINQILRLAQASPEREVCGLVGATAGRRMRCYPVPNVAERPECRFLLDPKGQIDALRAMRERGEELFAIFHSHPTAAAIPSPADLEFAAYPEALHLIVSLGTKGVLEMRGFRIGSSSRPREVELLLAPE
ncbi:MULTISPECIES: M67 family metallopeptidase [Methylococcus]|uniref:[CysO sulfur-carrier protein]-S-L-cysteine hydrolase n=1 Tax=Methylococcus capsulatus TaxID=414 RepID=A0AA35UB90_METCP|nr:M67 family metallopeptidase [Methylococcus capsulatus]CAI8785680.1 [CysO sulfur-carrier protein]-S-L-cysteine hydrolase [Methylococcus capsulatus]